MKHKASLLGKQLPIKTNILVIRVVDQRNGLFEQLTSRLYFDLIVSAATLASVSLAK